MNKRKYKAIPVINTDQTPFEYERKIYNVGDTARRSSFEIYPPIRSSFEIYPPLKDAARSPGTPQDSQVSLDLSTIEYALCPFSLVSKRPGLSHIAPSTPKQELRRSRGSHVTLDLTEMESQSLSAPPSPRKETKERRYRFTSHVSLDVSQVEPEFLSNQQAPKETSQIFLSQTETRALTSTSSQVRLDFTCVEPDLALGKYESQSISLALSEDSPKPLSSAEETTSSIAENSHASTEESEVQFISQEDSSDDSDDAKQEPEPSTPPERFPSFGRKKKKSSSRGQTTRRESLPETESGVLPVPSTQQENASAITDQSMIIDRFLRSTELQTRQVTGDETFTEGFINEVNYNEEKLEKASSRLTESGESVRRSEDRTIESKEIEDFEQDDNINLSTECAEYSAPFMDDSKNSVPGISGCLREDVRPLRQSKPCVALSDSNIQVYGEFTSSAIAATKSSVSHPLPSSGSPLSLQSSERRAASTSSFSRKRAVESTAQSQASGFEVSEVQLIPQASIQRSESLGKASLKPNESAKIESTPASSKQSPESALSEDSPKPSSPRKESTSSISETSHASTEESEVQYLPQVFLQRSESIRKASLKLHELANVESTPMSSNQSPGSALSEDFSKPSSSAKESTSSIVESSAASTDESEVQFLSQALLQRSESVRKASLQAHESAKVESTPVSSNQSPGNALSEDLPKLSSSAKEPTSSIVPETSTPRERFPSFGGKKKKSSSRGETTRRDSLPETEPGGLPVPYTQEENASAITDQSMIIERCPCRTELETRQVTGEKTFSEGFINEVNYNEEKLEKASSRLTESGESVIRSEAAPIESKEIEAFEQEDDINLATKCAEYSALLMDDSKNSVPEISGGLKEDVRPLRQSKPCVALSDSNIQVYGEFTSSAIAATTSSVSHPLPSSGSPLPLESSERRAASTSSFSRKRVVESTAQSQASGFEVSEVQFIPQALITRLESWGKASQKVHEPAKIESTPASSKQSPGSALSEDSPKPSSSVKESTSSIAETSHASTDESEVQFIPQVLLQRSESVREVSLKAHESAKVESTPVSSKHSVWIFSEDSPKQSSSAKESTSSIAEISQASTEESEILFIPQEDSSGDSDDTTQVPETSTPRDRFPLFGRKKKKSSSRGQTTRSDSLPETESGVLPFPSTQQENVSVITAQSVIIDPFPCSRELETRRVTGDETLAEGFIDEVNDDGEKFEKASGRKPAAELTAQSQASGFEESEIQFISHALIQRSEIVPKTSLKTQESAAIMTESAQVRFELGGMEHESQLTSQSSSEDSHTSSGGSKGDIDLKRDVVSSTSSFDTDQGSGVEFLSADESLRRKGFQSLKPDALEVITKYKSRVIALLSSASSEDDSLPLHQRSIEDLGESQSSYTKLKPVQSKIPRIPLKMKKALKISTSEKQHKLYSKFPQEDSSDDTTQEPETSTSRKRFPLFGRTKGKSSSRGPTTRRDSLPEAESVVLPVPSTQQEHVQVMTDQSAITYRFPCSAELETRQVTGDETLAEGFIDVGNDNGEKLEKTSSRLTESGESVMRSEDATIESKEIEDFEHEDNIDLFTECAEYLVPVMDDSKNLFPEISGSSREDVRPLLHSKPCKVLSDSNIQVCGESTSSTLASTTSSVSYPLPSSGSRLSLQPSERREASTCSFSRKRAVGSTAQSQTSGFEESEIQFIPQALIQRSESVCKTSLKKQESAAIITESAQVSLELGGMRDESQLASQSSSEDSHTSSGGSKGDIDLTRNVASSTSSIDTQSSSVEFVSADESFPRKSLRSLKPDALELTAKHQSRGVKLLSSESFEDASLPPHQRSIEDLGESQSPYTKLKPVQSKIPRISLKVKKAFKFSTSEKQHKLFSKFPQEGSSDDSDDTTQEPKNSTPRRRFSLFGRRKNRSSSRVQTTRRDSLPETESGVLPVPSTQQENAPVFTGKSAITDRFPCSTELETRQVTGDETLAKGFIDLANDNGETHDNAVDVSSSGLQNPEVSSTRTKQQETSHEDFGMLVSSMDNPPHGEDASMGDR